LLFSSACLGHAAFRCSEQYSSTFLINPGSGVTNSIPQEKDCSPSVPVTRPIVPLTICVCPNNGTCSSTVPPSTNDRGEEKDKPFSQISSILALGPGEPFRSSIVAPKLTGWRPLRRISS